MAQETAGLEPVIRFWKMNGSGNDFIVIDNREEAFPRNGRPELVARLCRRQTGVGADGLILLENDSEVDFRWRFYNADGSEAEMCGNGGRCAARFAVLHGLAPQRLVFRTLAGLIRAEVAAGRVNLELPAPSGWRQGVPLAPLPVPGCHWVDFINTGVPHAVLLVDDLENFPVREVGRRIRHADFFQPAGTNVNFIAAGAAGELHVRTYERGVEDETLACGTGSVAAALVAHARGLVNSPTRVRTRSGEVLTVRYRRDGAVFSEVFLEGDAKIVYDGKVVAEFLTVV